MLKIKKGIIALSLALSIAVVPNYSQVDAKNKVSIKKTSKSYKKTTYYGQSKHKKQVIINKYYKKTRKYLKESKTWKYNKKSQLKSNKNGNAYYIVNKYYSNGELKSVTKYKYNKKGKAKKYSYKTYRKINYKAIQKGDYSSLYGTWKNKRGMSFKVSKTGKLIWANQRFSGKAKYNKIFKSYEWGIAYKMTGMGIAIFPVGTSYFGYKTDKSKVRIATGHSIPANGTSAYTRY